MPEARLSNSKQDTSLLDLPDTPAHMANFSNKSFAVATPLIQINLPKYPKSNSSGKGFGISIDKVRM
jgi:hypothetical protein